jgi:hypothetical protein
MIFSSLLVLIKEGTMNDDRDPLGPWEVRIILAGLRILSVITFFAFIGWALLHLAKMFEG